MPRLFLRTWVIASADTKDVVTVQKVLGYSEISVTARYAHALADVKITAVSKLDLAGFHSAPESNWTPSPSGVAAESEVNSFTASTGP
jgi:hypothetical protein